MKNKEMKKNYMISRVILTLLTFIIFRIMIINEDSSWLILSFVFSLIVFIVSFPSTFISKIFVKIGDRLDKRILKILYYVIILPALIIFLFSGICCIISFFYERYPTSNDFEAILGQGLVFLFLAILFFICIIIPYIQTLLVLFLRRFVKDKEKNKTLRKEQ